MNMLEKWFSEYDYFRNAPLFLEEDLIVKVFMKGSLKKLNRHPDFDNLMINIVEEGLTQESWEGFTYIMHWLRNGNLIPLYIGKAERRGVNNPVSFNISNIKKNNHAFGRWGYGLAYHIGDLSHAIFGGEAYKSPSPKYRRWAEMLFEQLEPPKLRERVYVTLISWHDGMIGPSGLVGSVASVEKEIISLASVTDPETLLNIDGR
jgi:hypothetical protein